MRGFRIALVQCNSPVNTKSDNLDLCVHFSKQARQKGASLVCFPELNITGHAGHAAMVEQSESVPDGPSVSVLCELAKKLGLYICAGIAEDERGIHYNTQFIVGPKGFVGRQRKVHLSGDEYFYFRHGTDLPVFELPFVRVGIVICYDNLFPEVSRCLAVKGAELLLCPHAARTGKWRRSAKQRLDLIKRNKAEWAKTHRCRANDNGVYVALCNAAGRSAVGLQAVEANHIGGCMVIDPQGEIAAESRSRDVRDEMIVVDLDGKVIGQRRKSACFNLMTRRPEVYSALTRPTA